MMVESNPYGRFVAFSLTAATMVFSGSVMDQAKEKLIYGPVKRIAHYYSDHFRDGYPGPFYADPSIVQGKIVIYKNPGDIASTGTSIASGYTTGLDR